MRCADTSCVVNGTLCDGVTDCQDQSDEEQCGEYFIYYTIHLLIKKVFYSFPRIILNLKLKLSKNNLLLLLKLNAFKEEINFCLVSTGNQCGQQDVAVEYSQVKEE